MRALTVLLLLAALVAITLAIVDVDPTRAPDAGSQPETTTTSTPQPARHRPSTGGPASRAPMSDSAPAEPDRPGPGPATGWSVTGVCYTYVESGTRTAVANASITIQIVASPTRTIARGNSDANGRFRLDVTSLRRLPRTERLIGKLRLSADTDGRGTKSSIRIYDVPIDERPTWHTHVEVRLIDTSIVTGRVVDEHDTPVAGAGFAFSAPGEEDSEWSIPNLTTDTEGRFRFSQAWGPSDLVATKDSVGMSRRHPVQVTEDEPKRIDLGDVVLRPKGNLSGNVLFPDGTPVRWLPIYINSVDDDTVRDPPVRFTDGQWSAETETDENGRFCVKTLAPNAAGWAISTWQDPAGRDVEIATIPDRVRNAILRFSHRRVVVRPRDKDGSPIRRAYVTARVWRGDAAASAAEAYASRQSLEPLIESALVDIAEQSEFDSGAVSFLVHPNDYVLISVLDAGLRPFTHAFVAPANRWETLIDATLRPTTKPARLVVTAKDEAGEEAPVTMTLRDAVTRDLVTGMIGRSNQAGRPVPPGRYELTVKHDVDDPILLPMTRTARLEPGENRVAFALSPGGRVDLRLRTRREFPINAHLVVRFVDVQRPLDKPRIAPHWMRVYGDPKATWTWGSLHDPHAPTAGDLLRPGSWRIEVELYPNWDDSQAKTNRIASAARTVEITARKTLAVTIDL